MENPPKKVSSPRKGTRKKKAHYHSSILLVSFKEQCHLLNVLVSMMVIIVLIYEVLGIRQEC